MLTSQQRAGLVHVETVILDEIHQMVASKRGAHLFLSLERLAALSKDRELQRIGLSATQRPLDEIALHAVVGDESDLLILAHVYLFLGSGRDHKII